MSVLMVSYQVQKDKVEEVEAAIQTMIKAIQLAQPKGIRYALGKLPDGVTFVGLLELEEGVENPLPGIPEARAFQQNLATWVVGQPPAPQRLHVLASYERLD